MGIEGELNKGGKEKDFYFLLLPSILFKLKPKSEPAVKPIISEVKAKTCPLNPTHQATT